MSTPTDAMPGSSWPAGCVCEPVELRFLSQQHPDPRPGRSDPSCPVHGNLPRLDDLLTGATITVSAAASLSIDDIVAAFELVAAMPPPPPDPPPAHPTKVLLMSTADLPADLSPLPPLFGRPAVMQVDGEWLRVQPSPHMPPGQYWVLDTAITNPTPTMEPQ